MGNGEDGAVGEFFLYGALELKASFKAWLFLHCGGQLTCMRASVSRSTAAVASSNTKILVLRKSALGMPKK